MTSPAEEEQWARLIVFLLVGLYIFIITSIMIRFLIKTCALRNGALQQHVLGFPDVQIRIRAPETPPPSFPAALKCPLPPRNSSLGSIAEELPPSYEEVCAKTCAPKSEGLRPEACDLQGPSYRNLDPKDVVIHF